MDKIEKFQDLINSHSEEFERYFETLISFNEKVNLTAITDREEVYIKHFLDSILAIDEIPTSASLIDIGAGAGFPSLPIKIVRPDIRLTMLDSLNKRINFLNELCAHLNIESENVHSRAEDFAVKHHEQYDIATARAVARLNTLLEYLLPFVRVGGRVLAYKGSSFKEELIEAERAIETLGGRYVGTLSFDLPKGMGERNIIIIEKVRTTPDRYPRGQNRPKLDPIR